MTVTGRCDGCGYEGELGLDGDDWLCSVCRGPWPTNAGASVQLAEIGLAEQPVASDLEADAVLSGQVTDLRGIYAEDRGHFLSAEQFGSSHSRRVYPTADKKQVESLLYP